MRHRRRKDVRTVLCAIDFSEPSRRALRYAAVVAACARGRLVVLLVKDPLLVAAAAAARPRLDLRAHSRKEVERFVRTTLRGHVPPHLERRVTTGKPTDQILAVARAVRADVIVVGSPGLTGVARLAFGSTTIALLNRTSIPVLVVPARRSRAHRGIAVWVGQRRSG